jgi:cobalt-zinc-cadmium efflux system membrane fusion protein
MKVTLTLTVFCLAASACTSSPAPTPPDAAPASNTRETSQHQEGTLRLDPSMLRDLRMTTAPVERRTANADVDMLGEFALNRDALAEVPPPVDAQVMRLFVTVNTMVSEGEPLAELRSPDVGRARAELMAARARVELATQTRDRKRALGTERIVPLREVQEAESQLQEALAAQQAATTALAALGAPSASDAGADDSARFIVRSPLSGTVIERPAVLGQFAQASQPLYRIADLRRVWLTVHAFERDAVQVSAGTPVRITLAALPGREFRGTVALTGRQVDPASRTVDVRIDLPNPNGILRPGMSATAHVPLRVGTRELLAVPAAAVQRVGEAWVVFVPQADSTFVMRPVGRGRDLGTEVEIATGLNGNEKVVVDGAFLLKAEAEKSVGGDDHGHEE